MITSNSLPPNFSTIVSVLPQAIGQGVIFTYGDIIYNPSNVKIPISIIKHEQVHMEQQGKEPEIWWEKYLTDPKFRYEQELEAHIVEYKEYCKRKSSGRVKYLHNIATRLSSSLYGNIVSYEEAQLAILTSNLSVKDVTD